MEKMKWFFSHLVYAIISYVLLFNAIVLLQMGFYRWIPTSYWIEVNRIFVHNTVVGKTPVMEVNRTINREYTAHWTVEIEKQVNGKFQSNCSQSGTNIYTPGNVLPKGDKLTVDWWTWPKKCKLDPGMYRIDTLWVLQVGMFKGRTIRHQSNVFTVKPNE
ncbi:MAG: hypothetical protein GY943_30360 [Chloroflexi bacterium]|nr:hypothetical protein [Chloroflexota bacterium]